MIRLPILSLVILLSAFACRNQKSSTIPGETTAAETLAVTDTAKPDTQSTKLSRDPSQGEKYRLVVTFYSIGQGSEIRLINAFEDSIGAFSGLKGKTIDYEKVQYGREGETDFCLKLNELTPEEQEEFVRKAHETLKEARWVHIKENEPCLHRRKQ